LHRSPPARLFKTVDDFGGVADTAADLDLLRLESPIPQGNEHGLFGPESSTAFVGTTSPERPRDFNSTLAYIPGFRRPPRFANCTRTLFVRVLSSRYG